MRSRPWSFFKHAARSRVVYLLVVINLCFVASVMNRLPPSEHGLAGCVLPRAEELFVGCYFPPPPAAWEIVGITVNCPPLLASVFLTEVAEKVFPQLCRLMTVFNLMVAWLCVAVQWALVGRGIDYVISKLKASG